MTRRVHRLHDFVASTLHDIALDKRARIEVEGQRSSSLSARINSEADVPVSIGGGGFFGSGLEPGVIRPSATILRHPSSGDSGGSRSAMGRPRRVIRTRSPSPTRRSTLLKVALNSRTPISRI